MSKSSLTFKKLKTQTSYSNENPNENYKLITDVFPNIIENVSKVSKVSNAH